MNTHADGAERVRLGKGRGGGVTRSIVVDRFLMGALSRWR